MPERSPSKRDRCGNRVKGDRRGLDEIHHVIAGPGIPTGEHHEIFGPSHAAETAKRIGAPFLGRLPVDPKLAMLCGNGCLEYYAAEGFALIVWDLVARAPEARCQSLRPVQPERKYWQEQAALERFDSSFAKQH
jgi:hypothetical protein